MEFDYTIEEYTAEVSAREFVERCVDVARFEQLCKQCGNYDKRWSCPSFAFDPMEIWNSYRSVRLYMRLLRGAKDGQTMDAALAALMKEKKMYFSQLMIWEKEHPGSRMLSAGTCDLCAVCAKSEGEPCRHPESLRYSIEALGGDVEKCAQLYFNTPILWGHDGMAPAYYVLVGGLLIK